tara:strand:- start:6777 stop:7244 length:468 start_codon:yes stop_codon:yes gene_type:complete
MKRLKFWIAVGLGSGLSPRAPGTTGTIGVLPLLFFIWEGPLIVWIFGFLGLCGLSIWSIPEAGVQLRDPDHGQIVIDEWAGMWLAAFSIRFFTDLTVWIGLFLGFLGFRIFDITKPGLVSWCERKLPVPWGVLMDDIAAGGYVLILALVFGMISA